MELKIIKKNKKSNQEANSYGREETHRRKNARTNVFLGLHTRDSPGISDYTETWSCHVRPPCYGELARASVPISQMTVGMSDGLAMCLAQGRRSLWDRGDTSPQYLDWGDMITNVPRPQYF